MEINSANLPEPLLRMKKSFGPELQMATVLELANEGIIFVEDGNHGEYRPLQHEFVPQGIPFIRPPDLKDGRVDFINCDHINETAFQRVRKGIGRAGDIILTHRATVGRIAITSPNDPSVFVTNPGTTVWRSTNAQILDQKYLYCFMRSSAFMDQLWAQVGNNCTFDYVSLTQQRGLIVAFPPLDEQKAIAHIFGTLDDKIELNQQMNRTLEMIQWTLFKSWFTESNFPDDWQLLPLEECMEAIIDYRGKTPKKTESGIPLITAKIVKNGRINQPQEFIALDDYDNWMRRGIPKHGDVVMTTEAPLGEIARLNGKKVALAQRLITLRGKSSLLDNTYLKFLMQSSFVQDQLHARASGSTVLGIKQSELRQITFPVPSFLEQEQMMAPLKVLEDKIDANEEEYLTLFKTRDALLPKLLSGEIRVKNAEKVVEAVA